MNLLRHHQLLMSSRRLGPLAPDHDFGHTAFWPMQDVSGSTMLSQSGTNNGTYSGVTEGWTILQYPGPHSSQKSVYFNGTPLASYATIPDNDNLDAGTNTEYAWEFWLSLIDSQDRYGMIIGKFSSAPPYPGVTVFSNAQNVPPPIRTLFHEGGVGFRDSSASGYYASVTPSALTQNDSVWRHWIVQRRYESGSWKLQIYINATLVLDYVLPDAIDVSTGTPVRIMGRPDTVQPTKGAMSWLHWYKGKSFSASEAATIYSARTNW